MVFYNNLKHHNLVNDEFPICIFPFTSLALSFAIILIYIIIYTELFYNFLGLPPILLRARMMLLFCSRLGLLTGIFQYAAQVQGFIPRHYNRRESLIVFEKVPTVWSMSSSSSSSLISDQIGSIVENLIADMVSHSYMLH